jgi:DNA-binding NtrC family response regulator
MTLKQRMNDYERALLQAALQAAGGNQRRAAVMLGILPSTLSEKLKRLGLRAPATAPRTNGDGAEPSDLPA